MAADFWIEFATFADDEAASIIGHCQQLRIVWPLAKRSSGLSPQEILEIMIRSRLSMLRLPAPCPRLMQAGVRWALWFALSDVEGAFEVGCRGSGTLPPAGRFEEVLEIIDQLLGVEEGTPQRFLLHAVEDGHQLVACLAETCEEPCSPSGFYVDLAMIGHQLAERAGRPLLVLWSDQNMRRRRS